MSEASYGDVTGEYFALRDAAALVADVHALVWVEGPDAVSFLDGLMSQDLAAMNVGDVAPALLLAPQGKLRATLSCLRGDGVVGLLCDSGRVDVVLEDLGRFKIRVDAEIRVEDAAVLDVVGPTGSEALRAIDVEAPHGWHESGESSIVAALPLGLLSRFVVTGGVATQLAESGIRRAGRLAYDAVRIEAGEPVMGRDIDEKTIPQEAGIVDAAVSFTKGCYLGQELVARIDSRGRVNRHLRAVVIGSNVVPPEGATIRHGDKDVGALTSVAESLTIKAPVGLALVRREAEPGSAVEVVWDGGSVTGTIAELPLDAFS